MRARHGRGARRSHPAATAIAALLLAACGSTAAPPAAPTALPEWAAPPYEVPEPGLTFDYLLGAAPGTVSEAQVIALDGEDATAADVAAIRERGGYAICYVNAGAWEPYRADAGQFPDELLGSVMEGWPDERWLDIRARDVLLPLMDARMAECAEKGFQAVDFDNVHAFTQETGFPLTAEDQALYNQSLAELAHGHGMAAGLKNDLEQIPELWDEFDFAVNEECLAYDECAAYEIFVQQGMPVYNIEYEDTADRCERAAEFGLTSVYAPLALDQPGVGCP